MRNDPKVQWFILHYSYLVAPSGNSLAEFPVDVVSANIDRPSIGIAFPFRSNAASPSTWNPIKVFMSGTKYFGGLANLLKSSIAFATKDDLSFDGADLTSFNKGSSVASIVGPL